MYFSLYACKKCSIACYDNFRKKGRAKKARAECPEGHTMHIVCIIDDKNGEPINFLHIGEIKGCKSDVGKVKKTRKHFINGNLYVTVSFDYDNGRL